jgi:hypothetical protein
MVRRFEVEILSERRRQFGREYGGMNGLSLVSVRANFGEDSFQIETIQACQLNDSHHLIA